MEIPNKSRFKIDEVTEITSVKPYVLRYWENEFESLNAISNLSGKKFYSHEDIQKIFYIKNLLFEKKLTIQRAKLEFSKRDFTQEEVIYSDEGIVHSDEEVICSDDEVIYSDGEVICSDEEVVHSETTLNASASEDGSSTLEFSNDDIYKTLVIAKERLGTLIDEMKSC